jgi:hypothetical protein
VEFFAGFDVTGSDGTDNQDQDVEGNQDAEPECEVNPHPTVEGDKTSGQRLTEPE